MRSRRRHRQCISVSGGGRGRGRCRCRVGGPRGTKHCRRPQTELRDYLAALPLRGRGKRADIRATFVHSFARRGTRNEEGGQREKKPFQANK